MRYEGSNVEVIVGDVGAMAFPDGCFDSVGSFTMLHHLPNAVAQTKALFEMHRVLRPGGVLIVSDSLASNELHHFHAGDTYTPVEPPALLELARVLGFCPITLGIERALTLVARRPAREHSATANHAATGSLMATTKGGTCR